MTAVTFSFATKVAEQIGADPAAVYAILQQWEPFEGANARFNPLATTQPGGEDPSNPHYNTFGEGGQYHVRNYASEDAGAAATAKTLLNGNYPTLLSELRAGNVTAASADNIRKWGTTGFANQLAGGETGGTGAPSATDNLRKGQEERLQKLQDEYFAQIDNPPSDEYQYIQWKDRMTLIQSGINSLLTSLGRKDQGFANDLASTDQSIKLDTLGQNREIQLIDRFLGGLQESRGRAQEIAAGKKMLQEYGAPQGKTNYTYNELGSGFGGLAKTMGWDPGGSAINYPGQIYIDPEGDMNRYDQQFGVTGQIPGISPVRTQFSDIPRQASYGGSEGGGPATSAPWWPSNPGGESEIDTSPSSLIAQPFSPWGTGAGQMIGQGGVGTEPAGAAGVSSVNPDLPRPGGGGFDWRSLFGSDRKFFGGASPGLSMPTSLLGSDQKFFGMGNPANRALGAVDNLLGMGGGAKPPSWVPPWQQNGSW